MKNKKGHLVFSFPVLLLVLMITLSSTAAIQATYRKLQSSKNELTEYYSSAVLSKILVNDILEDMNGSISVVSITDELSTNLYEEMLDGYYVSITNEDGSLYSITSYNLFMMLEVGDEPTYNELIDKITDSNYSEHVSMSTLSLDWLDERSLSNFGGEDKIYVEPFLVQVRINSKGTSLAINYQVSGVYCEYIVEEEISVVQKMNTTESTVKEIARSEIKTS